MKIKNLATGSLFVLCIACGSESTPPTTFLELGTANQELQKCYEKLPVKFCNSEARVTTIAGKTSATPKSPCEDTTLAVKLTCKTQFAQHKLETMAQIMSFEDECERHYQPQIEKACGKVS